MYYFFFYVISCRIVVRIDSWEMDSQYPNGHFVRSLGIAGHLECEVAAILLENNLSVLPFSEGQVSLSVCLSVCDTVSIVQRSWCTTETRYGALGFIILFFPCTAL